MDCVVCLSLAWVNMQFPLLPGVGAAHQEKQALCPLMGLNNNYM